MLIVPYSILIDNSDEPWLLFVAGDNNDENFNDRYEWSIVKIVTSDYNSDLKNRFK